MKRRFQEQMSEDELEKSDKAEASWRELRVMPEHLRAASWDTVETIGSLTHIVVCFEDGRSLEVGELGSLAEGCIFL